MENQSKEELIKPIARSFQDVETAAFCGQMALILKAGISSLEGLVLMKEDAGSEEEAEIMQGLVDSMMEGSSFSESLEKSGLFPEYMLRMTAIGEETGTLDEVMEALQQHYERENAIRGSIRNAIAYPLIMIGMMIVVILVLLVKVMPIFNRVFVQLGTEMTSFSRGLLHVGNIINNYSVVFILLLAVLIVFGVYCTLAPSGKRLVLRIGYRFGFSRRIYEKIAACRFANGMALTLRSGLNPDRSLELVSALNDDEFFREKLNKCSRLTADGADLSQALHEAGIFTGMYARMASTGEKAGALDQVMAQIANHYQDDIDTRINRTLAVIEPTLVIILSVIVGIILLSVMLPLMGIMSSI